MLVSKQTANIFIICLSLLVTEYAAQSCTPYTQGEDPNNLPKLPLEFQARVEISLIHKDQTFEGLILYDSYDKRAELVTHVNNQRVRQIFNYENNQFIQINDNSCKFTNASQIPTNDLFFGIVGNAASGYNMQPPNFFLHFNNEYKTVKDPQTTWRGIPVNHYRSCQNWPERQANLQIDHYFKVPEFQQGVQYDQVYNETLVAIVVEGVYEQTKRAKIEYNFFEFRTRIENKPELYSLPEGIYCQNVPKNNDVKIPQIPSDYSFVEEVTFTGERVATTSRIYFSYAAKATRVDVDVENVGPIKIVHDFNSGIGYIVNFETGICTQYPLSGDIPDFENITLGLGSVIRIRTPQEMFFLDDSYYFAGKRFERGIDCLVFVSNRTDYVMPYLDKQPSYWVFEIYFVNNMDNTDFSTNGPEAVAPVAIKISSPEVQNRSYLQIFDFDSTIKANVFDVSQCFLPKDKKEFGIEFRYPQNINQETFQAGFAKEFPNLFYVTILNALQDYSFSPFRIIYPRLKLQRNGFVVYTGITNSPDPIYHFKRDGQLMVDANQALFKLPANSPTDCASICLSSGASYTDSFRCFSFDYCESQQLCAFYNFSTTTDPNILSTNESYYCDHYSKTVENFDAANTDVIYRYIDDFVARRQLLALFNLDNGQQFVFEAVDIFPGTLEATTDSSGFIPIGASSFFKQYSIFYLDTDLNQTEISNDISLFIRQRKGVSVDECARLCSTEPAFKCETLSFEPGLGECKWTSLAIGLNSDFNNGTYLSPSEGYNILIRDPLYDYVEFPDKTTTLLDYTVVTVTTPNQCAYLCTNEKKFSCKSFNLCQQNDGANYACLLSESHFHSTNQGLNLTYSPICTHYSRNFIDDYQLVPQTQLNVDPSAKYSDTSVDRCTQLCSFMESFLCRSFDFFEKERSCFLYKENLNDAAFSDVVGIKNVDSSHYSRIYLTENGISVAVVPKANSETKYGGGTIFGVVLALTIVGVVLGGGFTFLFMKYYKRQQALPTMEFVNPNYKPT